MEYPIQAHYAATDRILALTEASLSAFGPVHALDLFFALVPLYEARRDFTRIAWLQYWMGMASVETSPDLARVQLESAVASYRRALKPMGLFTGVGNWITRKILSSFGVDRNQFEVLSRQHRARVDLGVAVAEVELARLAVASANESSAESHLASAINNLLAAKELVSDLEEVPSELNSGTGILLPNEWGVAGSVGAVGDGDSAKWLRYAAEMYLEMDRGGKLDPVRY